MELKREIARAQRTNQPLALAFVDVDGLKGTNDTLGHGAGDRRLREAADAIRGYLRPYDLIVRFGGDEFLCALVGVTKADAAKRFTLVNADLAASDHASVTIGFTELEADDALEDLIARADDAMYTERRAQQPNVRSK